MTTVPKVTVLLPVRNGEPFLTHAIESVLGQSLSDFEFLIIDDGSTDRTADIVRSYADPRIRLLCNPVNLGLVSTLNRGLAEAKGEYVARIDADDVCLPGRLEAQVRFLDRHPEVGVLGSAVEVIDGDGASGVVVRFPTTHTFTRWSLCFFSPIAHPAAMMRRAVVERLGGYRAQAVHCEDYDLWWRASSLTQLANLEEVLLQLRKHDDNVTVRHARLHGDTVLEVCRSMLSRVLQAEVPLSLVAIVREQARPIDEDIGRAVELLFAYYRFCLEAEAPNDAEAANLRGDLAKRIGRLLESADPSQKNSWQRLRVIGRNALLAREGCRTAAEARMVRRVALERRYELVKDALREGIRSGLRCP